MKKDLVNLRVQFHKNLVELLKQLYPVLIILIGFGGCALFAWLGNTRNNSTTLEEWFDVLTVVFLCIGLFPSIWYLLDFMNDTLPEGFRKIYDDSLYKSSWFSASGYFIPNDIDQAIIYLAMNRLLEYDPKIEFLGWNYVDYSHNYDHEIVVKGRSMSYHTNVSLQIHLNRAEDNVAYKNVDLKINTEEF